MVGNLLGLSSDRSRIFMIVKKAHSLHWSIENEIEREGRERR